MFHDKSPLLSHSFQTGREPEISGLRAQLPPLVVHVDDHPDLTELIRFVLENQRGLRVRSFRRGDEALAFCRAYHPNLLITDLNHMHMDGLTLVRTIRRDRFLSDLPVIVFSGRSNCLSEVLSLNAQFMPKPCDWVDFIAMVDQSLADY